MPRPIEHKVHWRPALGTDAVCAVQYNNSYVTVVTGYLLDTLRKVTCKNCLKQMHKNENITETFWKVLNRAAEDRRIEEHDAVIDSRS